MKYLGFSINTGAENMQLDEKMLEGAIENQIQ